MHGKPLVDVVMVTYNHEKYIAQAIESVLEQKTSFPYRLIIADDHSTDGTPGICADYARKFPEKILCILQDLNYGIIRNYECAFNTCTAKYIAILEGDDYWIDIYKLQKQYDILENNQETGLVYSNFLILENNRLKPFKYNNIKYKSGLLYKSLLKKNFIGPLTVCFRSHLIMDNLNFDFLINRKISSLDYMLWLELALRCKFHFLDDITAVYRKLPESLSNSSDFNRRENFLLSSFIVVKYFVKRYPLINSNEIIRESFNKLNITLLYSAIQSGNFKKVKEYSTRIEPMNFKESMILLLTSNILIVKLLRFIKLV